MYLIPSSEDTIENKHMFNVSISNVNPKLATVNFVPFLYFYLIQKIIIIKQ